MQKLGFVGLGMMGRPMVENLSRIGEWELKIYDHAPEQVQSFSFHPRWGKSLLGAASLRDFADCEAVITMLPNSAITNQVALSLAEMLPAGALLIDMGSSNPMETMKLAEQLAAKDIDLLDAPVSGAVVKAQSGSLTIMVGGKPTAVEKAQLVLEKMGSKIIPTGGVGSAHAMKALNNYVYAAGLLAASEALLIADRMQLDKEIFTDVLNASSGKNIATETKLRQFIISETFNGGFALRLQAKDLDTADALRTHTGVNAPQLSQCSALWKKAADTLPANADNTCIYQFLNSLTA